MAQNFQGRKITDGCSIANPTSIKLRSGRWFDFADPRPDMFTLRDIAGGLAKECRFARQCEPFYSVAEHCCHCYDLCGDTKYIKHFKGTTPTLDRRTTRYERFCVLLHDGDEFVMGDIPRPLKALLPDFRRLQTSIGAVIAHKYAVPTDIKNRALDFHSPTVKAIDEAMLHCERRQLFEPDSDIWQGEAEAAKVTVKLRCWTPEQAEYEFANRLREIIGTFDIFADINGAIDELDGKRV